MATTIDLDDKQPCEVKLLLFVGAPQSCGVIGQVKGDEGPKQRLEATTHEASS